MKTIRKHLLLTIIFYLFLPLFILGQYNVVPGLQEVQIKKGKFKLTASSRIVADAASYKKLERDLMVFKKELKLLTGMELAVLEGEFQKGDLVFTLDANNATLGDEGYQIDIAGPVLIKANTTK